MTDGSTVGETVGGTDGDFVGVDIIESMTGSAAKYPLDSCSASGLVPLSCLLSFEFHSLFLPFLVSKHSPSRKPTI